MWIPDDRFVDCITAFFLPIYYFKPERRFGDAINLADKIPALIVEKSLAIGYEKLQVTDLRRVNGRLINLSDASVIQRVPHAAGS